MYGFFGDNSFENWLDKLLAKFKHGRLTKPLPYVTVGIKRAKASTKREDVMTRYGRPF